MGKKISVLTPVYNGEKFIADCIQNVIDQACPNVEHIIMDGGSSDRTVEIIQQYANQYPHIRWVSEKDQGQSDAMNKGIQLAQGDVMAVLNVDDYYEPGALSYVSDAFTRLPEPTLLVGNCKVWTEDQRSWISKPRRLSLTNILIGRTHLVNPVAYFYHASLHQQIGDYKLDEHYAMDLDFVIRAAKVAHLHYVDVNFGHYQMFNETKTVQAAQNGIGKSRHQYYLDFHTSQLAWFQRVKVWSLRQLFDLYCTVRTAI